MGKKFIKLLLGSMNRTVYFFFKRQAVGNQIPQLYQKQKVCEKEQEDLFAEHKSKCLQQAAVGSLIHCSILVNPLEPNRWHFLKNF